MSGGKEGRVRCYNVNTGAMLWQKDGHTDYLNKAVLAHDGTVVTGGRDSTLRRWDPSSGKLMNVFANKKAQFQGTYVI